MVKVKLKAKAKERAQGRERAITGMKTANQAECELLSNVSHELYTPLNAVIGLAELLEDSIPGEINEEQRQCIADILSSGRHLHRMIKGLLEMLSLKSSQLSIEKQRLSVAEIVRMATVRYRSLISEKRLVVSTDIPATLPEIEGDEKWLPQVMSNLLSNAVKFSHNRGTVTIKAERKKDYIIISVTDTGIGISGDNLERIFDEFYQVSSGLSNKHPGLGLGLSLSKRIVEIHGGRIWVESNPGEGSTFYFALPYRQRQVDIQSQPA